MILEAEVTQPMSCDPDEIASVLKDTGSGLQDKIVHSLGNFTVALLGISDPQNGSNWRVPAH